MRRNIKTIASLKRLSRLELNEKRRHVAALHDDVEGIRDHAKTLESSLLSEQKAAAQNPDTALFYGSYAQSVVTRRNALAQQAIKTEKRLEEEMDTMKDCFRESKRHEIIENRRRAANQAEQDKRDQDQLDELGINNHRRNKDLV